MKLPKIIKENLSQIIATVIASALISTAGAIISIRVNDARQDVKIESLSAQIWDIKSFLIRKLGN
jgi:hypothetical protein